MYVRFKLCAHRERFRIPCFVLGALDAGKGEKYEGLKKKKNRKTETKKVQSVVVVVCLIFYVLVRKHNIDTSVL